MKPLQKNEIFQNLSEFLKTRGIELKDGSYSGGIQKSCSVLTDAINLGQQSWERARVEVDKSLNQLRQRIHEKTAPKGARASTGGKTQTTKATGQKAKPAPTKKARKRSSRP